MSIKKGKGQQEEHSRGERMDQWGSGKMCKLESSFPVWAKAEKLKRPGKEALPGKQENRGRGSLIIRENLTKSPRGGENHCDGEVAEKQGRR